VESSKRVAAVIVVLALFLGSRATIALVPRHGISDTLVYSLYAFVIRKFWAELMRPTSSPNATYLLPTLRVTLLVLGRNLVWIGFCVLAVLHMRRSWWQSCLAKEADPSLKTKSPIPV
jgi:uncharacterized membrane protein